MFRIDIKYLPNQQDKHGSGIWVFNYIISIVGKLQDGTCSVEGGFRSIIIS